MSAFKNKDVGLEQEWAKPVQHLFSVTHKLRMGFTFLNSWEKNQKKNNIS